MCLFSIFFYLIDYQTIIILETHCDIFGLLKSVNLKKKVSKKLAQCFQVLYFCNVEKLNITK